MLPVKSFKKISKNLIFMQILQKKSITFDKMPNILRFKHNDMLKFLSLIVYLLFIYRQKRL